MSASVEMTFGGGDADAVPRARRMARMALAASHPDLVEDVELVVSELTTNAALHGEAPVTVRVTVGDGLRVEVEDAGRHLPLRVPAAPEATTGRGLSLVSSIADRWGVEGLGPRGKRVWAELGPGPAGTGDPGSAADGPADPDPAAGSGAYTVRVGLAPTALLLGTEAHIDGVVRELSLLREGEATGVPLPSELVPLVESLTVDFRDGRRQIERQAAAAAERGDELTDLELHLHGGDVEAGERYLAALDEADRAGRALRLLALSAPPVHRVLRQWCVGTAVEQLRALRQGRTPPPVTPLASVLGEQLGRLAAVADNAARLTLIETVAAELAAAGTASEMAQVVVDNAVRVLGVRSARVRVVTPRRTLRSVAWAGQPAGPALPDEEELPLDSDLPGPTAARTGRPVYVRDLDGIIGAPGGQGGAPAEPVPSRLSARILPLMVEGEVLGVLSLSFRTGELTEGAELSLASSLTGLLARALHRPLRQEDLRGVVLEMALRAAGVGTFDWDLRTGQLVYDRQLLEIFGRGGSGVLTIDDFYADLHPEDRGRLESVLDHVLATVGNYEAEYRVVLPDGRIRWVEAWGRALPGPDGTTARLLGVAQDTTGRVETRDRLARVMDAWAIAFFFVDRSWRFTYLNAEAERILDRRASDIIGKVLWDEFPAATGSEFERNYRHAAEHGEQVQFEAYYPEPLNAWYEVRAWPGPDGMAVYFLDITGRHLAAEAASRAISRMGLLARVTEELGAAPDTASALRTLAQLVVPALAEWCVVSLVDDDHPVGLRRGLTEAFGWHERPDLRPLVGAYAAERLGQMADDSLVVRAVESGEARVIEGNAIDELRPMFAPGSPAARVMEQLAPDSVAVLPLLGRHRALGILSVCNGADRGPFGDVDLELLRDVAARAGLTLDRARLYRQQQEVAEALQRSMLTPPPADGPAMAVRYVPAGEVAQVGGDWYDAFDHPDGSRMVIIGDVMGHDTLAAAAMGQVRTLLRTVVARDGGSPARALADAEEVMAALGMETLATVVVGRIEGHAGGGPGARLVMANAGHPPPLLLDPDGRVTLLADGPPGQLLGVAGPGRRDTTVDLPAGSTLLLYTDGLVERRDRDLDTGLGRLGQVLAAAAGADVDSVCDRVLAAMIDGNAEDDVALVAVRLP